MAPSHELIWNSVLGGVQRGILPGVYLRLRAESRLQSGLVEGCPPSFFFSPAPLSRVPCSKSTNVPHHGSIQRGRRPGVYPEPAKGGSKGRGSRARPERSRRGCPLGFLFFPLPGKHALSGAEGEGGVKGMVQEFRRGDAAPRQVLEQSLSRESGTRGEGFDRSSC
jgi:hypothetical protein